MSTNKTQNYALHSWSPTDDFQLSEVNANFAALDAGAVRMAAGSYTAAAHIDLGFQPKAVILMIAVGNINNGSTFYWSISAPGLDNNNATIDETGFTPRGNAGIEASRSGAPFHYIALY